MTEHMLDHIYEAAFVPDQWTVVLDQIATAHGCASGAIGAWNDLGRPIGFRATSLIYPLVEATMRDIDTAGSVRFAALHSAQEARFIAIDSLLSASQLAADPLQQALHGVGLGSQAATEISMPNGDTVCISFERASPDGSFDERTLEALGTLRPHLARAGMIAARLGLQRAEATVSAMHAIGMPAAVMSANGRVLATNAGLDSMSAIFLPSSRGGLAIGDANANQLFQQALNASASGAEPMVRSIAVAPQRDRDALVIHLLPLRRAAHEIFSGGDLLVVASAARANAQLPSPAILMGLFDFTAAEVKLATALAAGKSLQQAAAEAGITRSTSRTYLDRIFRKTGTHQQSQLVALLRSTHPIPGN